MTTDEILRVLQPFVFVVFVLHRAYYARKLPHSSQETLEVQPKAAAGRGAGLFALLGLASLAAFVANAAWMAWSSMPLPGWIRWTGLLVAASGFGLLHWSHLALGENWSDQPRLTSGQSLVTNGPYRWIRHPIYSAFLMILGSSLLISANWLIGLSWLAAIAIDIRSRIAFEERVLLARFGEAYRSYLRRTGSLVPRLGRKPGGNDSGS